MSQSLKPIFSRKIILIGKKKCSKFVSKVELDTLTFRGHPNILGLHKNTIEVTKDGELSKKGDCIVGVRADKGCSDLNSDLKKWIQSARWLEIEIKVGNASFFLEGRGDANLDLSDNREVVLRRSEYRSARTALIMCTQSAIDIPRELISRLRNSEVVGQLIFRSLPDKKEPGYEWSLP